MLDKCLRGNKIALLQHTCLASLGTCGKGVQFHYPSRTYAAIPYCTLFSIFNLLCWLYYIVYLENGSIIFKRMSTLTVANLVKKPIKV